MEIDSDASLDLLEKTQAMVEVEQSLTATLEKVEPWLLSATTTSIDPNRPRVRPIPQTMDQVKKILAVARNFSSRTSAPAEWNPAAPVVGFSTPNPLPHQLRGGALATLQLERARQAERDRKRQRVQQEEKEKTKSAAKESAQGKGEAARPDQPHRAHARRNPPQAHARRSNTNPQQQQLTTMNLSDSSSEDDSDSD